jgi:hypothetical protein
MTWRRRSSGQRYDSHYAADFSQYRFGKERFGAICATLALGLRLITSAGDATEGMRPSSLADTLL